MKKIFLFFLISYNLILFANVINVYNGTEVQNALNTASANGLNDTIRIYGSTYSVSTTFTYWTNENKILCLYGDSNPVFDGGNSTQIFNFVTEGAGSSISLINLTIQHGKEDYGGGAYLETQTADISVSNCSFLNNTANYVGGGLNIYAESATITVSNCVFNTNTSPNTSGYPYGTAGGLFVQTVDSGAEITLQNSTFEENSAHRDAAGAMLYPTGTNSTVNVYNNTFNSNEALEYGGGCWVRAPAGGTTVNIENNILENNSANDNGSAGGTYIEIESGNINYIGNEHNSNYSIWDGGGLWISNLNGNIVMHDNTFKYNECDGVGGGANIYLETGSADIYKNVFNQNSAEDSGGGLDFSTNSATLNLYSNTFYSNTSYGEDGGDIYLYFDSSDNTVNFYNNILFGSTQPALSYSGAYSFSARYCDIDGGSGESWFGTGCIDTDPMFVDSSDDDFNLTWTNYPVDDATKSPCIDAGDPASAHDADGTVADMGAFYFNQGAPDSPQNVTVYIQNNLLELHWNEVSDAAYYKIYSSDNPYTGFTVEATNVTSNIWHTTVTNSKKFYYVTAVK